MHLSQFYNTINQENEFRFRLPMGKLINDLDIYDAAISNTRLKRGGGEVNTAATCAVLKSVSQTSFEIQPTTATLDK